MESDRFEFSLAINLQFMRNVDIYRLTFSASDSFFSWNSAFSAVFTEKFSTSLKGEIRTNVQTDFKEGSKDCQLNVKYMPCIM